MPVQEHNLEYIFHPRSIAIVGVSTKANTIANNFLLRSMVDAGYQGDLYPIHPTANEVMGMRAYPSLLAIPGPVDQVVVSVPASSALEVTKDCAAKGVKVASFYTAGFSENNMEAGEKLEAELLSVASSGGLRIIGPNCMGIYYPAVGLSFNPSFPRKSGRIGFVCQSGGNAMDIIESGPSRDIFFSKVISYGNAIDLNEADFMDYFTHDSETDVIAAYIEGIKSGSRFISVLGKAASAKPVLLIKGGRTPAGSRAASSHTGSLAGVEAIWEAVYRQTGVIPADDMDEMADLLVVFTHMSPATGSNVAIIGAGGGASVLATDICERAGLIVPELPENARQKLREFVPEIGASTANPVDAPPLTILNPERVYETMMIVASAPEVDVLLIHMEPHIGAFRQKIEVLEMQADGIIRAANKCGKPVAMVITPAPVPQRAEVSYQLTKKYLGAGLATFPSTARAANAIAKFTRYHQQIKEEK